MRIARVVLWAMVVAVVIGLAAAPVMAAQADTGKQATDTTKAKAAKKGSAGMQAQTPPQPGMVWANTKSKVYHKEGDQWYGKGKNGKWMTEADAQKEGYREAKAGGAKKSAGKKAAAPAKQ